MKQLLINVPVSNIEDSRVFFDTIGFLFNKELTDENATCFNIDENIVLALLPAGHFKEAIQNNEVVDATKSNEMLLSVGVDTQQEVDTIAQKAITAGGKEISKPTDYGSIYAATFADLDSHQWNIFYMSPKKNS